MGLGGSILLILIGIVIGYILVTEIPWRKKRTSPPQGYEGMPKVSVVLVPAPEGMVQALTPPWQAEVTDKLKEEGFSLMGDYSYPALNFFWARTFISPDKKSVLLLVNWVEGKEGGKVIIPNLEIYSFTGNSFLLTACSQDGAARLLTGANRPPEGSLSLHLKAVFAESSIRPIMQEHQKRLVEWESRGLTARELNRTNVLPSLSKAFS